MHTHWRDCQEWLAEGLPISTTNNETAKLYDASITQYVGWYDDPKMGGLETTLEKLLGSDPDFVMGYVLSNGLDLIGTGRSPDRDPAFRATLDKMADMASKSKLTTREQLHVQAVTEFANGNMNKACAVWEEILFSHNTDILALKFAHDSYFYLGHQSQMCSSVARVIKSWSRGMPLYGYLKGMYSFGLVETACYEAAEREALEGLQINPRDGWSTHSMAHVYEMTSQHKQGAKFLCSTVKQWETCGMLASHNFWHWALFHIEKGNYRAALDVYDSEIIKRAKKSDAMLDIVDGCSLLFRLEMEGADVGSRWSGLLDLCRPHLDDHMTVFNDVHLLMSCVGAKQQDTTDRLLQSVQEFLQSGHGDQKKIMSLCGDSLMKAIQAYADGDYAECVDIMKPIRYNIIRIGGSDAQRDLFNLLLINAALKSPSESHKMFARHLLFERKAVRTSGESPMSERLMAKAMANHANGDIMAREERMNNTI